MADIKLTDGHDLDLSTGDIQLIRGRDETAQRLTISFGTYLGEWFLDSRVGVPYFQTIFAKGTPTSEIEDIFRQVLEKDDGIDQVSELVVEYDAATRDLTVSVVARDIDGNTVEFTTSPILDL